MTVKDFFNKLRLMSGGRLTQNQVDSANVIIEQVGLDKLAEMLGISKNMQLSDDGFNLIAEFEGFRSAPYLDAVGVPTIGYGNTYYLDGRKVKMTDTPITKDEAKALKLAIINQDFAPAVNAMFADEIAQGQITQNMFDAIISLAYNIGTGALAKSSIYRHIKAGDYDKAGQAFLLYNKAGGRVLNGLVRRREAEKQLFDA